MDRKRGGTLFHLTPPTSPLCPVSRTPLRRLRFRQFPSTELRRTPSGVLDLPLLHRRAPTPRPQRTSTAPPPWMVNCISASRRRPPMSLPSRPRYPGLFVPSAATLPPRPLRPRPRRGLAAPMSPPRSCSPSRQGPADGGRPSRQGPLEEHR